MDADADIASVAALISDPCRATMLTSLLDGRALPAGELAARARITASTASTHLQRLVEGGLLCMERQGRHHYYRLRDVRVAAALESLAVLAPQRPVRSLREADAAAAVRAARTCYDHLAGRLGVALTEAMVAQGLLEEGAEQFEVTAAGAACLAAFGLEVDSLRRQRRAFAPRCLDWSERRMHVAGALGAAIAQRCLMLGWIVRIPGGRAVRVTEEGRLGLAATFALKM